MPNPSAPRTRRPFQPAPLALALGGIALLALAVTGGRASVPERPALPESGIAVSVGVDDGTLLVATGETFELLVLDADAVILDGRGRAVALDEIRAGDRVVYLVTRWAGMSLSRAVRVLGPVGPEPADARS